MLGYALRRGASQSDAQDITVDTFTVLWKRIDEVRDPPLPWLLAVARRSLANQRRAQKRHRNLIEKIVAGQLVPEVESAGDHELLGALSRLSNEDREVLMLIAWDDLTHEEASEVLSCSRGAFTKRVARARKRLESQMRRSRTIPSEKDFDPKEAT